MIGMSNQINEDLVRLHSVCEEWVRAFEAERRLRERAHTRREEITESEGHEQLMEDFASAEYAFQCSSGEESEIWNDELEFLEGEYISLFSEPDDLLEQAEEQFSFVQMMEQQIRDLTESLTIKKKEREANGSAESELEESWNNEQEWREEAERLGFNPESYVQAILEHRELCEKLRYDRINPIFEYEEQGD